MAAKTPAVPTGMDALYKATQQIVDDPAVAIDQPWSVTRVVVLDALKMFNKLTGRAPRLIYLPKVVEVALEVDRGRMQKIHSPLRDLEILYGCRPVWDSKEFRVE